MLRGTAFRESGSPCAIPIRSEASLGGKPAVALPIVRLYRVLRGRAVRRGSASSAFLPCRRTTSVGCPPASDLDRPTEHSRYAVTKAATQTELCALMEKDDVVAMEPWLKLPNG
jgi:hypothetical protein